MSEQICCETNIRIQFSNLYSYPSIIIIISRIEILSEGGTKYPSEGIQVKPYSGLRILKDKSVIPEFANNTVIKSISFGGADEEAVD